MYIHNWLRLANSWMCKVTSCMWCVYFCILVFRCCMVFLIFWRWSILIWIVHILSRLFSVQHCVSVCIAVRAFTAAAMYGSCCSRLQKLSRQAIMCIYNSRFFARTFTTCIHTILYKEVCGPNSLFKVQHPENHFVAVEISSLQAFVHALLAFASFQTEEGHAALWHWATDAVRCSLPEDSWAGQ